MASHLVNLLVSTIGASPKSSQSAPAKASDASNDKFARLLDTTAPSTRRNQTSQAPSTEKTPASNTASADTGAGKGETAGVETTPSTAAAAKTTEQPADSEATESTADQTLSDALMAALAALGLAPQADAEGDSAEAGFIDPAALKDIEGALNELSELLGMDVATLMQQLADLTKGAAGTGAAGGTGTAAPVVTDLTAQLEGWIGEKLAAAGKPLDDNAKASLAKLIDGLGAFAKAIPTQPELGSAELKLTEAVIVGRPAAADAATAAAAKAEPVAAAPDADPAVDRDDDKASRLPSDPTKTAERPDAPEQKAQTAPQQAARPAAPEAQTVATAAPVQADPTVQVDATATPRVVQTGYQTSQQQLNLPQIAFELSRQVTDGNTRFQIRLDPADLGRIDVRLEIDSNGQVHAKLTVEKAETLDLMQRDQRALERALQQAGLDQGKTNLEFSLKQNPFAGDQNGRSDGEQSGSGSGQESQEETEVSAPAITLYRGALQASGVNIIA